MKNPVQSRAQRCVRARHRSRKPAFTLVELLVCLGILCGLLALLIPTVSAAQREARALHCQSNLRTLAQGLIAYGTANAGRFPPNTTMPAPGQSWADEARLGRYVSLPPPGGADGATVYVCPEDLPGTRRSYAMNIWASSRIDRFLATQRPPAGQLWKLGHPQSSRMVLLVEAWSYQGSATTGYRSAAAVGGWGLPGKRFGGGGGLSPFNAGRFGRVNCELDYQRHRAGKGTGTQPIGRLSIAFGDGHVELLSNEALASFATGSLTGGGFWSPLDTVPR